jgi:DUF3060 family protein
MEPQDDPEERIRELERSLADAAHASELGSSQSAGQAYPPGPTSPPPPSPWAYGGPFAGPPPKPPSGNRMWWILGTVIAIGVVALAGGIAAFVAHELSGIRPIITSPPTISAPSATRTQTSIPSTSPTPPPGGKLSVSGIGENRTITCNDSIVDVGGVSNTVMITGHCSSLTVSGVQNSVTVEAVDTIDASGFNNKVTYHSGTPTITNFGGSNVVQQG